MKKIWEYITTTMCKCSLKQFFNFDFMKDNVENVRSSSTNSNIYTIVISTNLKNSKNNALGCGKLPMFSKTILED